MPFKSFASLPGMWDRTIVVNGFSKGAAMTGFRLGYVAAPSAIIGAAKKVQGHNSGSPPTPSQHAAIAWLEGAHVADCAEANAEYRKKRDYVLQRVRAIPRLTCPTPEGAFYVMPSLDGYLGYTSPAGKPLADGVAICEYLLRECHVALVPGEAFGAPGCVRIAYATSMEVLVAAFERIEKGLAALKPPQ